MADWSAQQLVEYLAALSASTDECSAVLSAIERAAETLEADVTALVNSDGRVVSTGFPQGAAPVQDLLAIARGETTEILVPGVGACATMSVALDEAAEAWFVIARNQDEPFNHEDRSVVRGMARVLSLTLRQLRLIEVERLLRERSEREVDERRAAEHALAHKALHDDLTGLPNRTLLADRLDRGLATSRRQGTVVGVLFVDIDNFKLVNDTLGHQVGDELLKLVAERLCESLRLTSRDERTSGDTVARFGGDEFVLIGEGLRDFEDAQRIAVRVAARLAEPFTLAGEQIVVTASTGIAVSDARSTSESLIRDADAAMYHAKSRGRARFELFDDAMRNRLRDRLTHEQELRHAIEHDELLLFYQPIFNLRDDRIVAAEALVRWRHPTKGLLTAGDFVPLAEASGQVVQLDEWVMRETCRQLAEWQRSGVSGEDLTISLNVSARQLQDEDFADRLAAVFASSDVDPCGLALEITESMLIETTGSAVAQLESLRALGPRLMLDDFGTGYSSLSYLQKLPLDVLKLDRSFVEGLAQRGNKRDRDIIAALIQLATVLDLEVIAEGIETAVQQRRLKQLGCKFGQGYQLARPMPAAAFEQLRAAAALAPAGARRATTAAA